MSYIDDEELKLDIEEDDELDGVLPEEDLGLLPEDSLDDDLLEDDLPEEDDLLDDEFKTQEESSF